MPFPGTVWKSGTWDVDAWAANTWANSTEAVDVPVVGDMAFMMAMRERRKKRRNPFAMVLAFLFPLRLRYGNL